jgi:hypothetical protein
MEKKIDEIEKEMSPEVPNSGVEPIPLEDNEDNEKEEFSLNEMLDTYRLQEKIHSFEGRRGLEGLARIVRSLGYKDFQFYGQLPNGAALGDIFTFLEDNSGCIEAIVEWVGSRDIPEWKEELESHLTEDGKEEE